MQYSEWISKTSRAFGMRSGHLRTVDVALKNYSNTKSATDLVILKNALGDWQNSKDDWRASSRNLGGAVEKLASFVDEKLRLMNHGMVLQHAARVAQTRTARHESTTYHVSKEVEQVQRRTPPVTYKWWVRFDMIQRGTVVEVVVHIKPVIGDLALLDSVQKFWALHIERAWNIATIVERGARYDLQFRLNFTDSVADAYVVNVKNPPPDEAAYVAQFPGVNPRDGRAMWARAGTPHMQDWAHVDSQAVIHEFGHMIGCPDEYWTTSHKNFGHTYDSSIYNKEPFTSESIMNDTSSNGRIHQRHFRFVEQQYNAWRQPSPAARIEIAQNVSPETALQVAMKSRRQAMGYDD
jgi:hypothetical protein